MKKHIEKPPIDDLFARKLGNMALPSKPDSFERLQARMNQHQPDTRVVFWHNPTMQRYTAAAACLLLVCLFSWLYWPSSGVKPTASGPQIATNHDLASRPKQRTDEPLHYPAATSAPDIMAPSIANREIDNERLANVEKSAGVRKEHTHPTAQADKVNFVAIQLESSMSVGPVMAQKKPAETSARTDGMISTNVAPVNQLPSEQVAENKATTKSAPTAERVLVVTIAEPESLIAARETAKAKAAIEDKPVIALNDKAEKETKAGSLWQQVKRIKQGEQFARRDDAINDERGLLSRTYAGLKHNFDKDKSAKQ